MEVRSEPGIMSGREPFSSGMQKSPVPVPVQPRQPAMANMRLAYTADGTAVYKPITTSTSPPYQGAAGGSKPITTSSSPSYQGAAGGGKPITTSSSPSYQGAAGGGKPITATSPHPYQEAAGGGKPITTTSPHPYQEAAGGGKPITTTSPHPYQGAAGGGKPITTSSPPPYQGAGGGGKPITTSSPTPYQGAAGGAPGGSAPAAVGSDEPSPAVTPYVLNINASEPVKRKRGRPRKYGPNGSMALALTPVPHAATVQLGASGFFPSLAGIATSVSSVSAGAMKKARGRPPGSGKKHQMAALGSVGIGFTPHVITVKAGEDVYAKIMSFSQLGPRAICILSANGAISNVTLRQAATSGGTVTYEGRFEILSLSGSFLLSENGGQRTRTGGLSVSLAGPDGRVLGGGVAGLLTAASPIQVVVGSFITEGKKESRPPMSPSDPMSAPGRLALAASAGPSSLPLRGTQSGSSGGPGSPLNQSTGTCNNSNQQGMPNMLWK